MLINMNPKFFINVIPRGPSYDIKYLASQILRFKNNISCHGTRHLTTKVKEEQETVLDLDIESEEKLVNEAEIERKRNKSKLSAIDYNKQNDIPPEIADYSQKTLRYKRRLYGKYGELSQVNPSILWPSKEEMKEVKEYIDVLQPLTIHELMAKSKEKKELKEKALLEYQNKILEKVSTVQKEIIEFHKRVALKKKEAMENLEKKKKVIEEIRREVGYAIDPRDEKFKEIFEERERQQKIQAKAAKKSLKEEKAKAEAEKLKKKKLAEKEENEEEEN